MVDAPNEQPNDNDGLASAAQARVGTVLLRKYRLGRVLGIGGMAAVYKATHRNDAEFAVKLLHADLSRREDVRSRFLREGKAANSVKHPGVVAVVDDDVAEDGAAFLVMELLRGLPVETLWERSGHRLPLGATLSVALQLLDVLAAAHAKGVVHRDLKPGNLFTTRDGTLKVLDFGIARVKDATSGAGKKATGTGVTLGTPAFMAPEQAYAKASEIDGQTDLWAVGATLFTLLAGEYVHAGDNAAQLLIHAATMRARRIESVAPEVPYRIAAVIDRALAFEKDARWPDAVAMRRALEEAAIADCGALPTRSMLSDLLPPDSIPSEGGEAPLHPSFARGEPAPADSAVVTTATFSAADPTTQLTDRQAEARDRRRLVVAAATGTFLAAGILGVGLFAYQSASSNRARTSTTSPAPTAPQRAEAAPTPAAPAPTPAAPAVAGSPESADPPLAGSSAGSRVATTVPPQTTVAARPGKAAPPPPPSARPATAPCTVVTDYDALGQPHFKKVCK